MKTLLFLLIATFSTASLAHGHRYCHYGYGYTNYNVCERNVYRACDRPACGRCEVRYQPRVYYMPPCHRSCGYYYNNYCGPRHWYYRYWW